MIFLFIVKLIERENIEKCFLDIIVKLYIGFYWEMRWEE